GTAAMQAKNEHTFIGSGLVERLLDRGADLAPAGLELQFERTRMPGEGFRIGLMHAVVGRPEPEIGLRQRLRQRLRARNRNQPLLVGAAEENGDAHYFCPLFPPSSFRSATKSRAPE